MKKILQKLLSLFRPGCDHRFKASEVIDLNIDPACTRCGKFFSNIFNRERQRGRYVQFDRLNENEYRIIKL